MARKRPVGHADQYPQFEVHRTQRRRCPPRALRLAVLQRLGNDQLFRIEAGSDMGHRNEREGPLSEAQPTVREAPQWMRNMLARPEEPRLPSISYLNSREEANGDSSKTDWAWSRWRHALGDAFLPIL